MANSWTYTSSRALGSPTWSSADPVTPAYFLFGDVDSALARQACPFCRDGSPSTTVAFSPVVSNNSRVFDNIVLRTPDGQVLDPSSYRLVYPTDQSRAPYVLAPVLIVKAGIDFEITLDGSSVETAQPFTVTVIGPGGTRSLRLETLNPAVRGTFRISGRGGSLGFSGVPMNKGTTTHTFEQGLASYRVQGIETAAYHLEAVDFHSYQARETVVFRENDDVASVWTVRLHSESAAGQSSYAASGIKVAARSQLVVTYKGWSGASGVPELWLDRGSNGSLDVRIPWHVAKRSSR